MFPLDITRETGVDERRFIAYCVLLAGLLTNVWASIFSFFNAEINLTIGGKVPFFGCGAYAGCARFVFPALFVFVPSEVIVSVHIVKAPSLAVSCGMGSSEETVGHGAEQCDSVSFGIVSTTHFGI